MAHIPQDILDRLNSLEREVRLLKGRAQIRPALTEILDGDVIIGEGGQLIARTPAGDRVFGVGQTAQGDWGVFLAREDGSSALTVGDDLLEGTQMVRMWSRSGAVIAMDDAWADGYLGRPWVPIPISPFVNFTSDEDIALHSGYMITQHKVLRINAQIAAPAGTAAEVYMRIANTQYGPTWTLPAATLALEISERIPLPDGDFPHGSAGTVVMWARRTAGAGTATLRVRGIWGVNTINPTEAE